MKEMTLDEAQDLYNEYLDETTSPVKIAGGTFYASTILKNCDPVAYRSYLLDYCDANGIEVL